MSGWLRHIVAMTALLSCGFFVSPMVFAQTSYQFDLPEQPLADSLRAIGRQTDMNIVFEPEAVKGIRGVAVHGQFTADEAIRLVLVGTDLQAVHTAASNVVVKPKLAKSSATDSSSTESEGKLSEIIVTAQKKSERLQDVPVPVSVINTDALTENGQVLLRDYYSSVPSLNLTAGFFGYQAPTIRGIASSGGNPTVGVTVDDVPFGGLTANTGSPAMPDLDPADLDHIEVLRGPQGTLYGADSMGGLIKFVTKDPSTSGFSGRVESGLSGTQNGDQTGYSVRGSVNVPLSDELAIRASAFTRQDPGYLDNPVTGVKGINRAQDSGGRLSALWKPSEYFSFKLSALYQDYRSDGLSDANLAVNSYVGPALGDLQQNYIPGLQGIGRKTEVYSAVLNVKLAGLDLTSLTGYNVLHAREAVDSSSFFGAGIASIPAFGGVAGAPAYPFEDISNFSEEIRLSSTVGDRIEWRVGGIYIHENYSGATHYYAADQLTGHVVGLAETYSFPAGYKEYAGFADLTWHVTDRVDVQIGGRQSHMQSDIGEEIYAGPLDGYLFGPPYQSLYTIPEEKSSGDVFTYLFTPSLKLSPDLMIYSRLASGFRPASPNTPPLPGQPFYNQQPDKTKNYEVGLKGEFFDSRLSVDTSVYYIDWRNMQIGVNVGAFAYGGNAGKAKSQGIELSVQAKPLAGLTLGGWVAYDDAVLVEDFPARVASFGHAGDRLPLTSRFSSNFSMQQEFPLGNRMRGFAGGQISYVGDSLGGYSGTYTTAAPRQIYPAYAKTDLRAGVKHDSWTANLYVNNVADKRGLVGGGLGNLPDYAFLYITPRTVGLNISKTFD